MRERERERERHTIEHWSVCRIAPTFQYFRSSELATDIYDRVQYSLRELNPS